MPFVTYINDLMCGKQGDDDHEDAPNPRSPYLLDGNIMQRLPHESLDIRKDKSSFEALSLLLERPFAQNPAH